MVVGAIEEAGVVLVLLAMFRDVQPIRLGATLAGRGETCRCPGTTSDLISNWSFQLAHATTSPLCCDASSYFRCRAGPPELDQAPITGHSHSFRRRRPAEEISYPGTSQPNLVLRKPFQDARTGVSDDQNPELQELHEQEP